MIDRRRRFQPIVVPTNCRFCNDNEVPTYKKWEVLSHFMSERGKIVPLLRSGVCSKHQRAVARQIKHARHLALLPFMVRPL